MKDAHQRIIWGINFSHDDLLIATASREKQKAIRVWHGPHYEGTSEDFVHSEFPTSSVPSATAVRFFPNKINDCYALIVGQETGEITVWMLLNTSEQIWNKVFSVPSFFNHA